MADRTAQVGEISASHLCRIVCLRSCRAATGETDRQLQWCCGCGSQACIGATGHPCCLGFLPLSADYI